MEDKLILIYEMIIAGISLTSENLLKYNFRQDDIKCFLDNNLLQLIDENQYILSKIDGLYKYGIKLLVMMDLKKATKCFKKCYELDSENRDICLQILLMSLKRGHYYDAFVMFDKVDGMNSEKYSSDNDLYLYLLNLITLSPTKYEERLKNIDYSKSISLYSDKVCSMEHEFIIKNSITKNKYKYALRLLNDSLTNSPIYSVKAELLKELLHQTINSESKFQAQLLSFANLKKYHAIVSFLNAKMKKRYLNTPEIYTLLLAQKIVDIKDTGVIPISTINHTDSMYDAIMGNNFDLALKINFKFLKKFKHQVESNIVYILLKDINQLIGEIKEDSKDIEKTFSLKKPTI